MHFDEKGAATVVYLVKKNNAAKESQTQSTGS